MISTIRAAILASLFGLILAGLTGVVAGVKAYAAGREKERLVQTEIIGKMVTRHQASVDEANRRADALEEQWRLARQGADRAQENERAATRAALAAVNADRDRLREQLAAAASGGVQAADDSVAACRVRAAALGVVLGQALQSHAQCTADLEDAATGIRTLQRGWPSDAGESAE